MKRMRIATGRQSQKDEDKIVNHRKESKRIHFSPCRLRKPSKAGERTDKRVFGSAICCDFNSGVEMKRPLSSESGEDRKMKKVKVAESDEQDGVCEKTRSLAYFDDNLLFEVLKHVDARTLAMAGCVNKQWHKTAQDERLWELICTKQWANTGCGEQQLRSVVLALGGFRRLHSLCLLPLSKPQTCSSSSSSSWGPIPQVIRSKPLPRLGKDEVHLSLSLLSIRYYEKMNFNNRTR